MHKQTTDSQHMSNDEKLRRIGETLQALGQAGMIVAELTSAQSKLYQVKAVMGDACKLSSICAELAEASKDMAVAYADVVADIVEDKE